MFYEDILFKHKKGVLFNCHSKLTILLDVYTLKCPTY